MSFWEASRDCCLRVGVLLEVEASCQDDGVKSEVCTYAAKS